MDHTGDDSTVSVLFGNTWQDVNASVYAAVSAIVSSVVNGVDPSLAPRVRKAILGESRVNIAKISSGHSKADRPMRRPERQGGGKVIDNLRQNPRPVD